jgi:hypothetical protein
MMSTVTTSDSNGTGYPIVANVTSVQPSTASGTTSSSSDTSSASTAAAIAAAIAAAEGTSSSSSPTASQLLAQGSLADPSGSLTSLPYTSSVTGANSVAPELGTSSSSVATNYKTLLGYTVLAIAAIIAIYFFYKHSFDLVGLADDIVKKVKKE